MMIPKYDALSQLTTKFKFQYNFDKDKVDVGRFSESFYLPSEYMVDSFKSVLAGSVSEIGGSDFNQISERVPYVILCEEGSHFGEARCHGIVFESNRYENIDYDRIVNLLAVEIREEYLDGSILESVPTTLSDRVGSMGEKPVGNWHVTEYENEQDIGRRFDNERRFDVCRSLLVKSCALEEMLSEINEDDHAWTCDQSGGVLQTAE
jgi:hypothetical protein